MPRVEACGFIAGLSARSSRTVAVPFAIAIASLPLSRKPGGVRSGGSISFSGASGSEPNGGW